MSFGTGLSGRYYSEKRSSLVSRYAAVSQETACCYRYDVGWRNQNYVMMMWRHGNDLFSYKDRCLDWTTHVLLAVASG
jgi:hypothetical protein